MKYVIFEIKLLPFEVVISMQALKTSYSFTSPANYIINENLMFTNLTDRVKVTKIMLIWTHLCDCLFAQQLLLINLFLIKPFV